MNMRKTKLFLTLLILAVVTVLIGATITPTLISRNTITNVTAQSLTESGTMTFLYEVDSKIGFFVDLKPTDATSPTITLTIRAGDFGGSSEGSISLTHATTAELFYVIPPLESWRFVQASDTTVSFYFESATNTSIKVYPFQFW